MKLWSSLIQLSLCRCIIAFIPRSYLIGTNLGLTRQQCANMVRRVSDRIREALREVVRGEGVVTEDVERTVREVEELLGGG